MATPRRKQQFMVAGIVAVLMVIPFHFQSITMTPALALVIGNIIAFYFGLRRGVTLRLVSKQPVGGNGFELTFDTKPLGYEPGQYIELSLPHRRADVRGVRRVFTLIGTPGDTQVSIATRFPEKSSSFKRSLMAMKTGQIIYGTRVAGDFVLPKEPSDKIVFIAGGIGITPLLSFVRDEKKRDITLIYVVPSVADMVFVDELKRYDIHVIIVTPDRTLLPDEMWIHEQGTITTEFIEKYITKDGQPHVYISGSPQMVDRTKRLVKQAGLRNIHTDHFTGY